MKKILVVLFILLSTTYSFATVTYTPLEGYIRLTDLVSDDGTMTGKCVETKGVQVKVDDIVYFNRGNEKIIRIDGVEQVFIHENYVIVTKK
jgi:hypothetical protein